MAFQINTNNYSILAQKNMSLANSAISENIDHLSTGEKLTKARDDAAGLAMSEKIRGQIAGLSESTMNAQDAVSFLQAAEGGLEVITDMLQRLRELAVQAGNATYTADDRREIQKEVDQLKSEIDRIALTTEFNARKVLNGEASGDWSTTSAGVEVFMKGSPAEGNYRLDFETNPGQNAIYKTSMLMDEFYTVGRKINYPNGIKNVSVEGADENELKWKINDDVINYQGVDNTYNIWEHKFPDVITNSTADLTGVEFIGAEDMRDMPSEGYTSYQYPYTNFSGFYIGIEVVEHTTEPIIDGGGGGGWMDYFMSDGSKAFRSTEANGVDPTWFKMFLMDPSTGDKQDINFVTDYRGDAKIRGYVRGEPNLQRPDGQDASFEITLTAALLDPTYNGGTSKLQAGDKVLYFYQANSPGTPVTDTYNAPGNMNTIKNVEIELPLSTGTKVVNSTPDSKNPVVNVYWDLNPNSPSAGHAKFTAMTIEDGEFKEVKLEWDWDRQYSFNKVHGTYSVVDMEVLYPSELRMKDVLTKNTQLDTQENLSKLEMTQTLSIYGNDRSVDISVEGNETLQEFIDKLAHAIGVGLDMAGEGVMVGDLVMMVTGAETATKRGINALPGTLIIQTAMTGKQSALRFVGGEALLNALGLVTIQEPKENEIYASIFNAHTGKLITTERTTDRMLYSSIEGTNISIDSRVGVKSGYDTVNGNITFTPDNDEPIFLHIVDRKSVVQAGANEGQTFSISIGRMDTKALRIADTYVHLPSDAQKAITKFDQALQEVGSARAWIGAQINRVDYTIRGLSISKENMITADSGIRDLDIADESAQFARNQLILNAATAILAQANQLPQTALQLIGR